MSTITVDRGFGLQRECIDNFTDERPICEYCGKRISGPEVQIQNSFYHPDCHEEMEAEKEAA